MSGSLPFDTVDIDGPTHRLGPVRRVAAAGSPPRDRRSHPAPQARPVARPLARPFAGSSGAPDPVRDGDTAPDPVRDGDTAPMPALPVPVRVPVRGPGRNDTAEPSDGGAAVGEGERVTERPDGDRDTGRDPEPERHRDGDGDPGVRPRRRGQGRRVAVLLVAVAVLLVALVGGGLYLYRTYLAGPPDFTGPGQGDVVVQVAEGDSTAAIGRTLAGAGVVASVGAFLDAAEQDDRVLGVQPGSYQMRSGMSAVAAVERLLDPATLIGRLEIRGGVQLDDTRGPDGTVAPGVLSLIAQATCTTRNGAESCLTAEQLREAMVAADPADLGVPAWALDGVAAAEPVRRLEGLIAPGVYDLEPGATATEVLAALVTESTGPLDPLVSGAETAGVPAYRLLVIASLVEKEGIVPDMPRVARVIDNRLAAEQRLELDSTVNYPLDLQALATTEGDRQRPGPYNTYRGTGLPPTPIAAVGADAIAAALSPEPGPWRYFVRCQTDGTSCFAETFEEHTANIATARANGAF